MPLLEEIGHDTDSRQAPVSDGELRLIPVDQLHESAWNPRQYYPEAPMEELTQSMRESGFRDWLPLMVRPWSANDDYEIGAGHRRFRAAKAAGITVIPCLVRPMTDEQFLDVLNFDNTGREDVHPLHEAAGWRAWMVKTGKGVADIAARIGQSKEYVYQRLKYAALVPEAQQAFLDGKINARHAILIARCAPSDQPRALQYCEPPEWDPDRYISARDLEGWIKKNLHLDLSKAPFPLSSTSLLPAAGSCDACGYRVGNLPDFNPAEDLAHMCGQPACYDQKLAAHIEAEKVRMQTEYGYLVCVSNRPGAREDGVLPSTEWSQVPRLGEVPGAKLALMVEGKDAGREVTIVIQERLPLYQPPSSPPPAAKTAVKADPKAAADEKAQELARLKREGAARRRCEEETRARKAEELAVRQALLAAILDKTVWPPSREGIELMLEDYISDMGEALDDAARAQGVDPMGRPVRDWSKVSQDQLARLVAIVRFEGEFDEYRLGHSAKYLDAEAKRLGIDIGAVRKRASAEHVIQSCGIDFAANTIECKPGKAVLADITFAADGFVSTGVSLPVKGGEGYGEAGPLRGGKGKDSAIWKDRGEAIDAAFAWMSKFLAKVNSYAPATDATRAAAEEVRRWVTAGVAARAAIVSLSAPAGKTRAGVVGKLPAMGTPAKKGAPAIAKTAAAKTPKLHKKQKAKAVKK